MTNGQRLVGFALLVGYVAWLFLLPAMAMNVLAIPVAIVFGLVIALRFAAVVAALLRKPPPKVERLRPDELPILTILVPLYREADVVPNLWSRRFHASTIRSLVFT